MDFNFDEYILFFEHPDGNPNGIHISRDTIVKSGFNDHLHDFGVAEVGYIKINLKNVNRFNSFDKPIINYYQKPADCYPNILGYNILNPIADGTILRSTRGDDSLVIGWRVLRNGDTSIEKYINTYIKVNDTTTVDINY